MSFALATVALSMSLNACSNDDEEEELTTQSPDILGLWTCTKVTTPEARWFKEGSAIKFFPGTFSYTFRGEYEQSGTINGKKCLIDSEGIGFLVGRNNTYYVSDPTEFQWNELLHKLMPGYNNEDDNYSFPPIYTLVGNTLSIIECDLDRCVGTISITDDVMTFTYMYQNWTLQTGKPIGEEGPYYVEFQRKTK